MVEALGLAVVAVRMLGLEVGVLGLGGFLGSFSLTKSGRKNPVYHTKHVDIGGFVERMCDC